MQSIFLNTAVRAVSQGSDWEAQIVPAAHEWWLVYLIADTSVLYRSVSVYGNVANGPTKTTELWAIGFFRVPALLKWVRVCACVLYLRGLVGPPAVLVAVEAGEQHVLIRVDLAKAQRLVRVVADHVVAEDQLLGLALPILQNQKHVGDQWRWELWLDGWINRGWANKYVADLARNNTMHSKHFPKARPRKQMSTMWIFQIQKKKKRKKSRL